MTFPDRFREEFKGYGCSRGQQGSPQAGCEIRCCLWATRLPKGGTTVEPSYAGVKTKCTLTEEGIEGLALGITGDRT
jgi:hypothetical protein